MTQALVPQGPDEPQHPALTLVWIDSREAVVVRRVAGASVLERFESEVPPHHRATGHVRHDPNVRHGGGVPQTSGEPHRLEHLARFLEVVADALPSHDDLLILGPGTAHEHLARLVQERDRQHRVVRVIVSDAAARMTRPQLVARLRRAMGEEPRRRTVGAYRWSPMPGRAASGQRTDGPRRIVEKRRSRSASESKEA